MNLNTQHFIYALEVERTGSISQAAESFYVSQPTMSKAIRDVEAALGFPVFIRTSRGVKPTKKGYEFLAYAKKIVTQIEIMERALHAENEMIQQFSLAIPRVTYIAQSAAEFVSSFDINREMEIKILENSSIGVIDAVASGQIVLGVIRYHLEDEEYFLRSLQEKGLQYEPIWQSNYVAVMREDHPLAQKDGLAAEDFEAYIEGVFNDTEVPYIRISDATRTGSLRRILINDRAMQYDILSHNPMVYMWISPLPESVLEAGNLVQRGFAGSGQFKDILISKKGHRYTKKDREFINKLCYVRNELTYRSRIG